MCSLARWSVTSMAPSRCLRACALAPRGGMGSCSAMGPPSAYRAVLCENCWSVEKTKRPLSLSTGAHVHRSTNHYCIRKKAECFRNFNQRNTSDGPYRMRARLRAPHPRRPSSRRLQLGRRRPCSATCPDAPPEGNAKTSLDVAAMIPWRRHRATRGGARQVSSTRPQAPRMSLTEKEACGAPNNR